MSSHEYEQPRVYFLHREQHSVCAAVSIQPCYRRGVIEQVLSKSFCRTNAMSKSAQVIMNLKHPFIRQLSNPRHHLAYLAYLTSLIEQRERGEQRRETMNQKQNSESSRSEPRKTFRHGVSLYLKTEKEVKGKEKGQNEAGILIFFIHSFFSNDKLSRSKSVPSIARPPL